MKPTGIGESHLDPKETQVGFSASGGCRSSPISLTGGSPGAVGGSTRIRNASSRLDPQPMVMKVKMAEEMGLRMMPPACH